MSGPARRDVCDAIVVGGGHNGLTCAAYLARGGMDVLVLEARDAVGGCASTVPALDGARVNVCNCDHSVVRGTGIVEELDLQAFGLRYIDLDPDLLSVPWDGSAPWLHFVEAERTLESLSLTHPQEVAPYRRYLHDMLPVARLLGELINRPPSPGEVARVLAGARGRGALGLLRLSRMSLADALRRYFSSEALLGSVSTTGPSVWGLAPRTPGTGLAALGLAMRHTVPVGRPVGGSGALTEALAGAVRAAGGQIRTGARVARILCGDDAVAGVELVDGERLHAPVVVSSIDPRTALVDWLTDPPAAARRLVERWRARTPREGYESKIDAIVDRLPRFRGLDPAYLERLGVDEPLGPTAVMAPTLAGAAEAATLAQAGRIAARPPMLTNIPSVPDPAMAPDGGGHLLSLEVLFTPYRLEGGWRGSREPDRWLEAYAEMLEPGFLEGVRRHRVVGPEDYERDFSLPAGWAPSFAGGPLAALAGADRELTRYTTPVRGLHLTGAGTFPGAGVAGASGRNAAAVVLAARGGVRPRGGARRVAGRSAPSASG